MALSQYPFKGGVPTGTTAQRPANPKTGDVFYDGTLGFLMIWDGDEFIPCSAPAAQPSITVADVGTSRAYGSGAITVSFTEGVSGGKAAGFTALASSYTQTSTSSTITLVVGNNGAYSVSGTAYNGFGTSPSSLSTSVDVTTIPQAPTIGSASTSSFTSDATVTWTLGSNGGKNLSSITITPYLNGTTAQTSQTAATTSSTSHAFTGLTANSSYTFKVKTTNANGTSLESNATNSVTIPVVTSIDYLVVAGGGGGGGITVGGGGGAGGMRTGSLGAQVGTVFTCTVGNGGTGVLTNGTDATNGGASSLSATGFTTVSCTGGGAGGNYSGGTAPGGSRRIGNNGGSGGGGGDENRAGGTGVSGEGNSGGTSGPQWAGGGGGGKNAAGGSPANNSKGGSGGDGLASSITGSSVTYAGGGGGCCDNVGGDAGAGGGGLGGGNSPARNSSAGTANRGGGGGGTRDNPSGGPGSNGGSGIVILSLSAVAASTTGSPTYTQSGGRHIYQFTGTGTLTV